MLTHKLTGTLALTGFLLTFGCGGGDDEDTSATTNADDESDDDNGDDDDSTASVTVSTTDTTTASTTASTTDDPTTDTGPEDTGPEDTGPEDSGTEESESGGGCTPQDECQNDNDCPGGGDCLGCICVGGTTTGGFPTMSDYGPCDACADGEMPVEVTGVDGCFCSPGCAGEGADCAMPNEGTAEAVCILVLKGTEDPTNCALICDPEMEGMCPTGATCEPVPMSMVGVCVHPAA